MIVVSVRHWSVGRCAVRGRANSSAAGIHALEGRRRSLAEPEEESALAASLTRLKNSLELGAIGNAITRTDPVPSKAYELLGKVGDVFSNPESAQKFLTFPGAHELSEHPKIVASRRPEISDDCARALSQSSKSTRHRRSHDPHRRSLQKIRSPARLITRERNHE